MGVKEIIVGTIGGAILHGPVAGTSTNIASAIALGIFAGALSALFYRLAHYSLNRNKVIDSLGTANLFVVALMGTFLTAPIIYRAFYNSDVSLNTFASLVVIHSRLISSHRVAAYVLAYVGISLGIGALSGLIISLISKCLENNISDWWFDDRIVLEQDYGLSKLSASKAEENNNSAE